MGLVALSPTWEWCEYVQRAIRVSDSFYQLGLALLALLMLGVDTRAELAFSLLLHCWVDLLPQLGEDLDARLAVNQVCSSLGSSRRRLSEETPLVRW